MKIAINKCFGGFSLSDKAIEMIMKRKGLNCYRYKQTKFNHSDGADEYTRLDDNDPSSFIRYCTTDLGEKIENMPYEDCWYYGELERTDKDLISVIEELGIEASGRFGRIVVIEIPDDVDWEIDDYDGIETIHEKHRVWG